jgi:hypothetical protein
VTDSSPPAVLYTRGQRKAAAIAYQHLPDET